MDSAIRCSEVSKTYLRDTKDPVEALRSATFAVRQGEVFGMIGADGAGKTTTFRILSGVMDATSGAVEVLGRHPHESHGQIGYLTQPFSLYQDLSVNENIGYAAGLHRVPAEDARERASRYLEMFGMAAFRKRQAGRLSGGMKQKLALACALVSGPKILLLDEPTTGVDPVSRREFWDALAGLADQGMTIVVATPYLDEAERCSRVACIDNGEILDIDAPALLRSKLGLTRLAIRTGDLRRTRELLSRTGAAGGCVRDVQRYGDHLDVMVRRPEQDEPAVRNYLSSRGVEVTSCRRARPTLENAFVSLLHARRRERDPEPLPRRREPPSRPPAEAVLLVANLNKKFGEFQAVKEISFEIRPGEIYGLLGANGAGKTTAIKMICGLLKPTSGRIALLGHTKKLRSAGIRSRIGYKSQKFSLYDDLTLEQNLDFYASVYGIEGELREERKKWVLAAAGLEGQGKMLTGKLPGGWQQRVAFGSAVMHEPEIVLLDEPTSGVDPLARRTMWRMIDEIAAHGAAVLVVTHYLEEAEQCHRLGFMVDGAMAAQGTPREIKAAMEGGVVEVETSDPQRSLELLRVRFGEANVSLFGDQLHVFAADPGAAQQQIQSALANEWIEVRRIEVSPFGLEDVFIRLTYQHRRAA